MNETTSTPAVQTADERVLALFALLQAKKAEIANAEKPVYVTGGQFRYSESIGQTIDLISERQIQKLISISDFIIGKAEHRVKSNQRHGTDLPFTWLGYTEDEWQKDVATRISILQLVKRKTELAELEARVDKVMSPALREKLELIELEKALGI